TLSKKLVVKLGMFVSALISSFSWIPKKLRAAIKNLNISKIFNIKKHAIYPTMAIARLLMRGGSSLDTDDPIRLSFV
ncbi:MAG: hypothetical protein KDC54_09755, partial [Lewinella sp.]|nr:hypothetical protein [Lewinella sp.]